jgi:UDP-glucose:(heptosyl)LPS alpha-1,3-glucosyltransferase
MKIAVVVKDFDPRKGGVERFAFQFVSQAAARGHQLQVLANRWKEEDDKRWSLHRVPALRWPPLAKLITFPLSAHRVLKKTGPFDVVFALTPLYTSDVYRVGEGIHREVLQRRYRSRLGRAWKRWGLKSQYLLWMEGRMFSPGHVRKVITISDGSRRELLRHYPIREEQVVTIYNGVDLARFNPSVRDRFRDETRKKWGIEQGEMTVLFVGNDFRRKGLMVLVQALGILKRKQMRIKAVIVGRDSPAPFVRASQRLGIQEMIAFPGPTEQVEEAYAGADLFVMPSYYDPFGFSCLEAMACGLPVVTTRNAGASEIIEAGKNGTVIPAHDPFALAEAIRRIWQEAGWGRVNEDSWKAAQRLSLERNTEAILSLFAGLGRDS